MTLRSTHDRPALPRAAAALFVSALFLALGMTQPAAAFCGFYVTGADSQLYANATMVVLMRDGTRTVLSMQNNYQGPPSEFALVIPVPTVLQKDQVKVLPKDVFQRVDALGAPRLVEYWETDPCYVPAPQPTATRGVATIASAAPADNAAASSPPPVRIEAQFAVGEYDVVVLSADDSSALDTWLRDNKYNIPSGAAPVLAPYVASGMKFFVAKVDPSRVTFNGDQAALSPLRFHYDSQDFSLPVRLGLLNSAGSQDLIVNILAPQRYEVANYANVTVPTNIRVRNEVRDSFASFYEALFSRVLEQNPRTVVTEYAWTSSTCDPCPTQPLSPMDIATLGGDVLQPQTNTNTNPNGALPPVAGTGAAPIAAPPPNPALRSMTLTRLHARYTKDSLGEDLVFKQVVGITGGRGVPDTSGMLNQTVQMTNVNNFQGRYVILHPWEGAVSCQNPRRGIWGGPSGTPGSTPMTQARNNGALQGTAPTAGDLTALIAESVPALSVTAKSPLDPLPPLATDSGTKGAAGSGATSTPSAGMTGASAGRAANGGASAPKDVSTQSPAAGSGAPPTAATNPSISTPAPTPTHTQKGGCAVRLPRASDPVELMAFGFGLTLLAARRRARRARARG